MAVTTNWVWESINRNRDYSIVDNTEFYRENWQVVRYRISDAAYVSELGDTSSSLPGYNGGVTETVTPPSYSVLTCPGASYNGPDLSSYQFYPTQWTVAVGQTAYYSPLALPYYSGTYVVIDSTYSALLVSLDSGVNWAMVAEPTSVVESGDLTYTSYASYLGAKKKLTVDWGAVSVPSPISGTSCQTTSVSVPFRCISDLQSYNQQSVDWFTQTQTWIARSPWS